MATNVLPTPGTGDNVPLETTPTPAPVAPETNIDPQLAARQELYAKYYGQQAQPPGAEPAPVPEPTPEPTPVTPDPTPQPPQPDLNAVLRELAELKAALNNKPQPPAPVPPAPVEPTTPEEKAWVKKLNSGDLAGFEEEFANAMKARIASGIQQEAVERALTLRRVEDDIQRYTDTVRAENPDLDNPAMTHFIVSAVERRVAEAMDSGGIKDPIHYAEVYKGILAEEVKQARTFIESLRGTATPPVPAPNPNIRREIISGAGVTPTPSPTPGAPTKPALPPVPTFQDYMAQRMATSNRGKMLG